MVSKHSHFVLQSGADYDAHCAHLMSSDKKPTTCLDLRCRGFTTSGVYTIYPTGSELYSYQVYCDQKTDGGGWTVSYN